MPYTDRYMTFMGMAPKRIPHWEHWSCPDAKTYITGIDYYEHPRLCRLKMKELYPQLNLPVPETDDPKPRSKAERTGESSWPDEQGRYRVRWGDGETSHWDWGEQFKIAEEVFAFSPLEHADFTNTPVVESRDYSDEEVLYQMYRKNYPAEWGDKAPEGEAVSDSVQWTGRWGLFHICAAIPNAKYLIEPALGMGYAPQHNFAQHWTCEESDSIP